MSGKRKSRPANIEKASSGPSKSGAKAPKSDGGEDKVESTRAVNIGIAIAAALIGIGVLAYAYFRPIDDSDINTKLTIREAKARLDEARDSMDDADFDKAEQIANEVFYNSELRDEALLIAAECATKTDRPADAIQYYGMVQADEDEQHIISLWATAEIMRTTYNFTTAEMLYRQVLQYDPDNLIAHRGLANVLGQTGRRWQSREHLFALVRAGDFDINDLMLLGEIRRMINQRVLLEDATQHVPNDAVTYVGLAQIALASTENASALEYSEKALQYDTSQVEAHIVLGHTLLEREFPNGLDEWRLRLPADARDHPEIWFIFGSYCESIDKPDWGIRCYWEACRLDPNHGPSIYRLGRLLQTHGTEAEAIAYLNRSQLLNEFTESVSKLASDKTNAQLMENLVALCESMGRLWEACGWVTILAAMAPDQPIYEQKRIALRSLLNPELPLMLPANDVAQTHELSRFQLPAWADVSHLTSTQNDADGSGSSLPAPVFTDVASQVGLQFEFDNGDDLNEPGMQIYQEMGGAIVVLDFDQDGWQDVYLSQGGAQPMQTQPGAPRDRLFRNRGDGTMVDVTDQSNLGDQLFSQGASAGDLNNDGYPDLLVCNIDKNRLYLNCGDGTFEDITDSAGIEGRRWSTSGAIADINQDGIADLYICNYAAGTKPYTERCDDNGVPRACQPNQFVAEQDRVYFGRGDGTWVDVTLSSGFTSTNGRALGVVIGDLTHTGETSLFIANDTTENFFYRPTGASPSQFVDEALVRGLSGDFNGTTQACMGVAVDDSDGDGLTDMYVTNFYNESNTLYRQTSPGLFEDHARIVGLRQPSMPILGFGTQFLDPELDGWPDLVVTNGHVDDYTHVGHGFRMRPQFYRNLGKGEFVETPRDQLSDYFQSEYLGRSLATLDWNRDGRPDFCVMHLDKPVSLLQNETPSVGSFVRLRLTATDTARDAFGTKVEFVTGERTIHKQLFAGSGYQASNERSIHVGLGNVTQLQSLIVTWPSGRIESFPDVETNSEYHLVEGSGELVAILR